MSEGQQGNTRRFDPKKFEEFAARYSEDRWAGRDVNLTAAILSLPEEVRVAALTLMLTTEQDIQLHSSGTLKTLAEYLRASPGLATYLPKAYEGLAEDLYVPVSFGGDYIVENYLDSGAQGTTVTAVYRKGKKRRDSRCVIKYTSGARSIRRLETEFHLIEMLPAGTVRQAIEFGEETQAGVNRGYLVLEYLPGKPLKDKAPETVNDSIAAARIVSEIAKSLQVVHSHGICHRDIKPQNLMEDHRGRYQLIDFGLAAEHSLSGKSPRKVDDHSGTPEYMSPQQCSGRENEKQTASDIYALGGVLYFLLTGEHPKPPYSEAEVEAGDLATPWRPALLELDHHPWRIREICLRAMRVEEKDRFPSAAALARAIDWWLLWRRHRLWIAAAFVLCLLLGVVGLSWALGAVNAASPTTTTIVTSDSAPQSSWISSLLEDHGLSESDITKESFDVSFELGPGSFYSPNAVAFLRVQLNDLPEDLLAGVEYRFGKRAWKSLSGWTIAGSYRASVGPELYASGEPLQIQLDSEREHQQGQVIGPFTYHVDIQKELQDYAKRRAEAFQQAVAGQWLAKRDDHWFFTNDFLENRLPYVHVLWGGDDPNALQPYQRNRQRVAGVKLSQAKSFLENLQHPFSFRQTSEGDELRFYLQLEGHDGQKSEVRSFEVPRSKANEAPRQPAGFGGGALR